MSDSLHDRSALNDISPDFVWNKFDSLLVERLLKVEKTARAIRIFSNEHRGLSDYSYWYLLGSLWVSYTGWTKLDLWRRLFMSPRPNRDTSLMKPSELAAFRLLPDPVPLFRAHREHETDWISYTLKPEKACEFAQRRGTKFITAYTIPKEHCLCLFLRRGEFEVLSLTSPPQGVHIKMIAATVTTAAPSPESCRSP